MLMALATASGARRGTREGYQAVAQEPGSPPRFRSHRYVALALASAAAVTLSAAQLPSRRGAGRRPPSASMHEFSEGIQRKWWVQACNGIGSFLPMCQTSTTTTTATATTTNTTTATLTVTTTETATSTTSTRTTTSTVTTTTVTSTPWQDTVAWVGCYELRGGFSKLRYENTLPRPSGYTSAACVRACGDLRFLLLHERGRCECVAEHPEAPDFHRVPDDRCGEPCDTEEALAPLRRCGSRAATAAFRVNGPAKGGPVVRTARPGQGHPYLASEDKRPGRRGRKQVLKGISYAPVPLMENGLLPDDDFMSESTSALWGSEAKGRGDLAIIRALGANTVRLYGNDPRLDHGGFLDEAMRQGLRVVAGISDYPYTQMAKSCIHTDFNCYEQVREAYTKNLRRGFLTAGNVYHPALRTLILMNEPDLKFMGGPRSFCKALISAFDAALDAEREVGVTGQAPSLTTTFSFGVCPACSKFGSKPAVGQMLELREAMRDPESVGYQSRNDLGKAYEARFINSVNTANPATDIRRLFLDTYDRHFEGVPVFIGEYHSPRTLDQQRDLETIMAIASDQGTMLSGISFFEYQIRYDKGGSEMSFGMFGLEKNVIKDLHIGNTRFQAHCLQPLNIAELAQGQLREQCGAVEADVDYISDSPWYMAMDAIPSPADCCGQCKMHSQCKAWTWVEDAGIAGAIKSQCWLKGGKPTGKVPKDGVVSALAYKDEEEEFPRLRRLRGRGGWRHAPHHGGREDEEHEDRRDEIDAEDRQDELEEEVPSKGPHVYSAKHEAMSDVFVHTAVAKAFGGPGLEESQICPGQTTTTRTRTTSTKTTEAPTSSSSTERTETSTSTTTEETTTRTLLDPAPLFGLPGLPVEPAPPAGFPGMALPLETTSTDTTTAAVREDHSVIHWHGCFRPSPSSEYMFSNELEGYGSNECAVACAGFRFALLHAEGRCSCAAARPEESNFQRVDPQNCGEVCRGEAPLTPRRYCGDALTFAVYALPPEAAAAAAAGEDGAPSEMPDGYMHWG